MNRITKIEITPASPAEGFMVAVTKEFAPENGGGFHTFTEHCKGPTLHYALDVARGMVTLSPAYNPSSIHQCDSPGCF